MVFEPLAGKRYCVVEQNPGADLCPGGPIALPLVKLVSYLPDTIYQGCGPMTLVQDNLSAHKPSAFYEGFDAEKAKAYVDKTEFIFTPAHGSWLNMAGIELCVLQRDCLNRHIATEEELAREVKP